MRYCFWHIAIVAVVGVYCLDVVEVAIEGYMGGSELCEEAGFWSSEGAV